MKKYSMLYALVFISLSTFQGCALKYTDAYGRGLSMSAKALIGVVIALTVAAIFFAGYVHKSINNNKNR